MAFGVIGISLGIFGLLGTGVKHGGRVKTALSMRLSLPDLPRLRSLPRLPGLRSLRRLGRRSGGKGRSASVEDELDDLDLSPESFQPFGSSPRELLAQERGGGQNLNNSDDDDDDSEAAVGEELPEEEPEAEEPDEDLANSETDDEETPSPSSVTFDVKVDAGLVPNVTSTQMTNAPSAAAEDDDLTAMLGGGGSESPVGDPIAVNPMDSDPLASGELTSDPTESDPMADDTMGGDMMGLFEETVAKENSAGALKDFLPKVSVEELLSEARAVRDSLVTGQPLPDQPAAEQLEEWAEIARDAGG